MVYHSVAVIPAFQMCMEMHLRIPSVTNGSNGLSFNNYKVSLCS